MFRHWYIEKSHNFTISSAVQTSWDATWKLAIVKTKRNLLNTIFWQNAMKTP